MSYFLSDSRLDSFELAFEKDNLKKGQASYVRSKCECRLVYLRPKLSYSLIHSYHERDRFNSATVVSVLSVRSIVRDNE